MNHNTKLRHTLHWYAMRRMPLMRHAREVMNEQYLLIYNSLFLIRVLCPPAICSNLWSQLIITFCYFPCLWCTLWVLKSSSLPSCCIAKMSTMSFWLLARNSSQSRYIRVILNIHQSLVLVISACGMHENKTKKTNPVNFQCSFKAKSLVMYLHYAGFPQFCVKKIPGPS